MHAEVTVSRPISLTMKLFSYSLLVSLIVTLVYLVKANLQATAFKDSDCSFVGIRVPNAQTHAIREATSWRKLAKIDQDAYVERMRIGQPGYAQAFSSRERIEKAIAQSDDEYIKDTFQQSIAGCRVPSGVPSDLHYLKTPPSP